MFVGHYAASLALKSLDKRVSLGLLFIGVQLVDILFFPFVLMGIERFELVERFTESTHFNLVYMPYTHSLVGSTLWAVLVFGLFMLLNKSIKENKVKVAILLGISVLSHWFLDLIVHTPDLPLLTDSSPKLGFGLWNNALLTYSLEAVLLLGTLVYYMKSTKSHAGKGHYAMPIFVAFLLLANIANIFAPFDKSQTETLVAVSAIVAYGIFAGLAFWLDKKRI
jgi:hypothetical protein